MKMFGNIDPEVVKTPYEFYRTIRPEYFSDSHKEYKLSREMFGYELSKLSTDMKQDEFERFACRVIGRIVTPNIIPPTGPNGGGDGKVDFETYVVDDHVSSKWYVAEGCNDNERWAFAVSCVAQWDAKIKHDIESAISTKKHYDRFHFCTNQTVSSKKKLAIQQEFKEKYGVETIIFDFNWFVDAVFDKGCYQIAIESLNLSKNLEEIVVKGPLDTEREAELKQVEERIQNHVRQAGVDTEYVDDLKRAAILARELELPWTTIEGYFYRAIREAEKYGMSQQLFEIHYQLGWTEFYWHQDPEAMYEQYLVIKGMLKNGVNPNRIERVLNLLNLLRTAVRVGLISSSNVDIEKENNEWEELCQSIIDNPQLTTSALYTQMLQLEMKLTAAIAKKEPIDNLLKELMEKINESLHHLDIDVESYSTLIETLSPYIQDNPVFEELVDNVAEIVRRKDGDASFAKMHFARGIANIQKEDHVSAIKHLGQCIAGFQQTPTIDELIHACCYIGYAFEKIDLLNAAKVYMVKALSLLFHEASTQGKLQNQIFGILSILCRIELRQGDLNGFLNWYVPFIHLMEVVPNSRNQMSYEELARLDAILASLLLQSNIAGLPSQMPDVFQRLGLQVSRDMLLYKLGYEEQCCESFTEIRKTSEKWSERWETMLPKDFFIFPLHDYAKNFDVIKARVKGCYLEARYDNNSKSRVYATLLLALVESYFSTAEVKDVSFITPCIKLTVGGVEGVGAKLEAAKKSYEYRVSVDWKNIEQKELDNVAVNFLAHVLSRNASHRNEEEYLKEKDKKERIGERLCVMASYMQDTENGRISPFVESISAWVTDEDQSYPMRGDDTSYVREEAKGVQATNIITSLIDKPVWDNAKWRGCAYKVYVNHEMPPIMMFMYKDIQYGKQIFEAWEEDFNKRELNIRISILTGIDKDHPTWYKVLVTPEMNNLTLNENQRFVMTTSRFRLMEATTDKNLKMFREAYERFKYAGITAVEIDANNQMSSEPGKRYPKVIPIRNVRFLEAWTICEHDMEMAAIQATDHPVIPQEHLTDAPVLKVLEKKRQLR